MLNDNESYVCTSCRHELPLTNFHFDHNNTVKHVLYGRVNLEHATALLHFSKKGIVQQLMHNLKYRGIEGISLFLGQWLGEELKSCPEYQSIDMVIPVPLHKTRFRKRGYNQVSEFGKSIARALEVDYNGDVLRKISATKTQVFKNRLKRSSNSNSVFALTQNESLKGKHILLVDDIITTGATIENCSNVLLSIDDVKISVATMAITD